MKTDEPKIASHITHSKGLAALMGVDHSITALLCDGLFDLPALHDAGPPLSKLLLRLHTTWKSLESITVDGQSHRISDDLTALEKALMKWESSRADELRPTNMGRMPRIDTQSGIPAGCWPGNVATYFDVFVAGAWNIYRMSRLLLIAFHLKVARFAGQDVDSRPGVETAHSIAEDMLASIPYHLTDNLQNFLDQAPSTQSMTERGRTLGGLLLMHPLYLITQFPFIEQDLRQYARTCLQWIGTNMGLGQATVFANVSSLIHMH